MFEKFSNKRSKLEIVVQIQIYEIIPKLIDVLLREALPMGPDHQLREYGPQEFNE